MVKDGIHIIFPNIIGHTKVFKEFIKNIMKEDNNKEILINIFKETSEDNIIPTNKAEDIIDSNVQRWFVYGDCKSGKKPYLLTKIINKETFEIIDKKYNNGNNEKNMFIK